MRYETCSLPMHATAVMAWRKFLVSCQVQPHDINRKALMRCMQSFHYPLLSCAHVHAMQALLLTPASLAVGRGVTRPAEQARSLDLCSLPLCTAPLCHARCDMTHDVHHMTAMMLQAPRSLPPTWGYPPTYS